MQTLIEFIAGLIALLAAAALSVFGVDMNADRPQDREVRRVTDCDTAPPSTLFIADSRREC